MARSINDIYEFYRYIVRKERGVFITISQFETNIDAGQLDAFEEYFKPYGANQTIHDALRPFRVYYNFISDASGFVTFPDDYQHIAGTAFTVLASTVNAITFVNEDEFVSAVNSQLRPVSISDPIARDTDVGFSLYPQTSQVGAFTYLRRPATPVLFYLQTGRTITYYANYSTQLEWSDVYINNIIAKALRYAGVNMDEKGVSDFANMYNAETK